MTGKARTTARAALSLAGLGLLAIPAVAVGLSGAASSDALWTALRVAALEGFTLVFIDITIGAFRPLYNKVAKPRAVHRLHVATGLAGFTLVVGHAAMVLVFGLAGYSGFRWVGPPILFVLAVAIGTAFWRRRLRHSWRWIHRLNYLVFATVLVHGWALGFDFRSTLWLKVWFVVCAAVVASGLAYRLTTSR